MAIWTIKLIMASLSFCVWPFHYPVPLQQSADLSANIGFTWWHLSKPGDRHNKASEPNRLELSPTSTSDRSELWVISWCWLHCDQEIELIWLISLKCLRLNSKLPQDWLSSSLFLQESRLHRHSLNHTISRTELVSTWIHTSQEWLGNKQQQWSKQQHWKHLHPVLMCQVTIYVAVPQFLVQCDTIGST